VDQSILDAITLTTFMDSLDVVMPVDPIMQETRKTRKTQNILNSLIGLYNNTYPYDEEKLNKYMQSSQLSVQQKPAYQPWRNWFLLNVLRNVPVIGKVDISAPGFVPSSRAITYKPYVPTYGSNVGGASKKSHMLSNAIISNKTKKNKRLYKSTKLIQKTKKQAKIYQKHKNRVVRNMGKTRTKNRLVRNMGKTRTKNRVVRNMGKTRTKNRIVRNMGKTRTKK
jgi:hypothetical protein